jgi:small GTP-binding protein
MSHIVKCVLIGDYGVGKSSIASRYINNTYNDKNTPTLGVDFYTKVIHLKEKAFKFHIWDTAGQERFLAIIKNYLRDLNVCFIVFDLTNKKSFENLEKWLYILRENNDNKYLTKILVGNKFDGKPEVGQDKIEVFCKKYDLYYYECSAKVNYKLKDIFIGACEDLYNKLVTNKIKLRTFPRLELYESFPQKKLSKCCIIL